MTIYYVFVSRLMPGKRHTQKKKTFQKFVCVTKESSEDTITSGVNTVVVAGQEKDRLFEQVAEIVNESVSAGSTSECPPV